MVKLTVPSKTIKSYSVDLIVEEQTNRKEANANAHALNSLDLAIEAGYRHDWLTHDAGVTNIFAQVRLERQLQTTPD